MSIMDLSAETFDETIAKHNIVVIDFWAAWCQPCLAFAKVFEAVSTQHNDVLFAKVDIEAQQSLAQDFNIRSVPFTMILRERIAVFAEAGLLDQEVLDDLIVQAKQLNMNSVREHLA